MTSDNGPRSAVVRAFGERFGGVPALVARAVWALSWIAASPVLERLESLDFVAGTAIFILWLLLLVLLPAAALFATGIWIAMRPRQPAS